MLKSESGAINEMKVTDSHSTPAYAYDTTDGAQLNKCLLISTICALLVDKVTMERNHNFALSKTKDLLRPTNLMA